MYTHTYLDTYVDYQQIHTSVGNLAFFQTELSLLQLQPGKVLSFSL